MAAPNGIMTRIIMGAIITTAVGTTGTGIIYNRNDSIKNFKEVRVEIVKGDTELKEKIEKKIEKIEDIVTDIRLEQKEMAVYLRKKL